MGVMECDRAGCENIMCHRRSVKHGYLCEDCFKELVEKLARGADVTRFMFTPPPPFESVEERRAAAHARAESMFPIMESYK